MQLPCRRLRRPRRVEIDMGRRPLVRRRWRRGYGVSRPYGRGCLPGHRHYLERHDSLGFDAGRLLCPLAPREHSRSLARPPPAVCDVHHARDRALGASGRFAPAAHQSSGMAHPCPRGCISRPQVHHTRVSCDRGSAPGRRHPRAMSAAPAPDFHRLSGLTSLSGWLPTTPPQGGSNMGATIAPAPKRHQRNLLITLAAAAFKADLAPRHYRILPHRRHAAEGDLCRFRPPAGSDGALRLTPPA